jgi:hypothetical protein
MSQTTPLPQGTDIAGLPTTAANRPSLPRIDYAADSPEALHTRLSQRLPQALPGWNARLIEEGGDYAMVLSRLCAQMCAILGGYADHRANEGFLRTATLTRSLIDLSTLIDYRPGAGSSATSLQAFLVKPGQTGSIPAGFRINAAPVEGSDTDADQVFQTLSALQADASRNAMRLVGYDRSNRRLRLRALVVVAQDTSMLADGVYAGIKTGVPLVFDDGAHLAAVPLTASAEVNGATELRWSAGAPVVNLNLAIADTTIYGRSKQSMKLAVAERADEITLGQNVLPVADASLFAARDVVLVRSGGLQFAARILSKSNTERTLVLDRGVPSSLRRSQTLVLKATPCGGTSSTIRVGTAELTRDPIEREHQNRGNRPQPGDVILIADDSGIEITRAATADANTITLVEPTLRALRSSYRGDPRGRDITGYTRYFMLAPDAPSTPRTTVRPMLLNELSGIYQSGDTVLALDKSYEGLMPGTVIGLSDGVRTRAHRVALAGTAEGKTVLRLDGHVDSQLRVASLQLYGPYEHAMRVAGHNRSETVLAGGMSRLDIAGAPIGLGLGMEIVIADTAHAEGARIARIEAMSDRTRLSLARPLEHAYTLGDLVVYGNVAAVSHGASIGDEVLGSGDPTRAPQRFALRKTGLALVADANAVRGVRPAVDVRVDGELWTEVDTLAASGPLDRHYSIELDDRERATIVFGEGLHGASPPSGRNNIIAAYRIGHGIAANVGTAAITTMPSALPFLERSFNPIPASGGSAAETPESVKRQAAHRVRTLDRAVALGDYVDLALSYAGVAKARADMEREGSGRAARSVIVLTVAADGGSALSTPQKEALLAFLAERSHAPAQLRVRDYRPYPIRLDLRVNVSSRFLQSDVQRALLEAFGSRGFFGFDQRELGTDLVLSDVYVLAESIAGVDHLIATAFYAEHEAARIADRIFVPADALVTGGDATDPVIGRFALQMVGGLS